jgi:hypothetical protein
VNGDHPRELFERALDGELESGAARRLQAHLDGCEACAAEFRMAQALRRAGLSTAPESLTAVELGRLEAGVTAAIDSGPPVRWRLVVPAAAAAAALSVAALWLGRVAGESERAARVVTAAVPQSDLGEPVRGRDRVVQQLVAERLGLGPNVSAPDRVVLADFDRASGLTSVTLVGGARPALKLDAASGRLCLAPGPAGGPSDPLELEVAIPAGRRDGAAGVSLWVRADGGEVEVAASGMLVDGTLLDAASAQRVTPTGWAWAAFSFPREAVRQGGGLARVHFRFEGAGGVNVGRIEMWASRGEGIR